MAKKKSPIKLRSGANIGLPAAEDDHKYLKHCFVDLPLIDALVDLGAPQCVLLGRTGAGKSAILWYLEEGIKNTSRVHPKEVAFQYIGNSPIIRQVSELGVDLHSLYEYLWKHILTVHIIRECLSVRSGDAFKDMLLRLSQYVWRDKKREAALAYLKKHEQTFWVDAEGITKEVTNTLSETLGSEVGMSGQVFKTRVELGEEWKEHEKRIFRHRAQEVVSALQLRDLNETISILGELLEQHKAAYYVLIDDLDTEWAGDEHTQYAMVRALIECLKSFRRIPNLKIIVAMREDLYEATLRATTDKHFQAEKLEGIIKRLRWTKELLNEVVDERIHQLFCWQYTKQGVRLRDVFPESVVQSPIRNYLVAHTLRRPRDIIALVNKVLAMNEGAALPLTSRAITRVEPDFSRERMKALVDEWRSCHPLIESYLKCLHDIDGAARVDWLDENRLFELIIEVTDLKRAPCDEIEKIALAVFERDKELKVKRLARALVCCLFKVGAIGVKVHQDRGYVFCYDQHATLQDSEMTDSTKFMLHPMLRSALGAHSDQTDSAPAMV